MDKTLALTADHHAGASGDGEDAGARGGYGLLPLRHWRVWRHWAFRSLNTQRIHYLRPLLSSYLAIAPWDIVMDQSAE